MSVNFRHICIIYVKIYEKMSSGGLEVSLSICIIYVKIYEKMSSGGLEVSLSIYFVWDKGKQLVDAM